MVPEIEEIIRMVVDGKCTPAQAVGWIAEQRAIDWESADAKLRDHFAMAAMQGMLASNAAPAVRTHLASEAFAIADAMMLTRGEKTA